DFEPDETFEVVLAAGAGYTIGTGTATGTIQNDDLSAEPTLSIDDPSVVEGNGGTQVLTFTVTLSEPAPAGGVSFDYATTGGSASAGSDYVAIATTSGSIDEGETSTTIDVTINGDIEVEGSETVIVSLTNPGAGSIVIDGEGVGTITDDDTRYPIWQIQGSGAFSPLVPGATLNANSPGQANVPVRAAVVTAVKYRATDNTQEGFFIQTLPGEDDGDAATSEGLFVFRSV